MKKAIYLLSVFFCIIAISACQPTPEKEIVVHKAAEQLEATLVESDDKEADSTFICPNKFANCKCKLDTCTVEIS